MQAYLVIFFLITETLFVAAHQKTNLTLPNSKILESSAISELSILSDESTSTIQRRRDPGYYYNVPNRLVSDNYRGFGRHDYRGRIVTRLLNQVNRPFNQYGTPNRSPFGYQKAQTNPLLNQDVPEPVRYQDFMEENPIASQNNQPFGQHTANYLPPSNQKPPSFDSPKTFLHQNNGFSGQLQTQFNQQHSQQVSGNNENFMGENFEVSNENSVHNHFPKSPISDAALFLTQNAQAISELYGAPASHQNYAPYTQEFENVNHQQQQSSPRNQNSQISSNQLQGFQPQSFHVNSNSQTREFTGTLPSFNSHLTNSQETLNRVQTIEKDRLIAQLRQTIAEQETTNQNTQNFNNNFQDNGYFLGPNHQLPSQNPPLATTPTAVPQHFQGYYDPLPPPATTPQTPTLTASSSATSAPLHIGQSSSGSAQVGLNLPTPVSLKPNVVNSGFTQYASFAPTFVATDNFVPTYGTTFFPSVAKPVDNAPTHIRIPIPTFEEQKPVLHHPNITPATINSNPQLSRPIISIPLGTVHHPVITPVQHPLIKPQPVPVLPAVTPIVKPYPVIPAFTQVVNPRPVHVIPAETPVHPTYGLHPSVINPSAVYKPVKVYPVYYYPNGAYSHSSHRHVSVSSPPWNYAPSYAQIKQIWK